MRSKVSAHFRCRCSCIRIGAGRSDSRTGMRPRLSPAHAFAHPIAQGMRGIPERQPTTRHSPSPRTPVIRVKAASAGGAPFSWSMPSW